MSPPPPIPRRWQPLVLCSANSAKGQRAATAPGFASKWSGGTNAGCASSLTLPAFCHRPAWVNSLVNVRIYLAAGSPVPSSQQSCPPWSSPAISGLGPALQLFQMTHAHNSSSASGLGCERGVSQTSVVCLQLGQLWAMEHSSSQTAGHRRQEAGTDCCSGELL